MSVTALLLLAAIGIEVASTALLPKSDGFTRPGWSALVILGYACSIALLSVVVRTVPVSVAYAIWSGLGTALVAVIGVTLLGESLTVWKVVSLAFVVVGVVGLNLSGAH